MRISVFMIVTFDCMGRTPIFSLVPSEREDVDHQLQNAHFSTVCSTHKDVLPLLLH